MRTSALIGIATAAVAAIAVTATLLPRAHAESPAERGKYLVVLAGCNDCHTPGFFLGKPDMAKYLGGSDVGFEIPGLGVFPGRNITPDKETGIGSWTLADFKKTIRTGVNPKGEVLMPPMPIAQFQNLPDSDLDAIYAYLRTVKPIRNVVGHVPMPEFAREFLAGRGFRTLFCAREG